MFALFGRLSATGASPMGERLTPERLDEIRAAVEERDGEQHDRSKDVRDYLDIVDLLAHIDAQPKAPTPEWQQEVRARFERRDVASDWLHEHAEADLLKALDGLVVLQGERDQHYAAARTLRARLAAMRVRLDEAEARVRAVEAHLQAITDSGAATLYDKCWQRDIRKALGEPLPEDPRIELGRQAMAVLDAMHRDLHSVRNLDVDALLDQARECGMLEVDDAD